MPILFLIKDRAHISPVAKWGFRGEACFRVGPYGKHFIVDYVTWTCPEPKSVGCPLDTLEEFFLQPKQNGPL